jgi:aspartyl-tRNA(Asn)/glutamyl-tRNA(Gln) amidotransferase subunit A
MPRPFSQDPRPDYSSVRRDVLSGRIRAVRLAEEALRTAADRSDLNAYTSLCRDRALAAADEADRAVAEGRPGRLAGCTLAVKDLISMEGLPATCGSRMMERYASPYTATAVRRIEAEGAVVVGRTNMDEFGMGSSNENSAFGPVRNPADPGRIPGGSSGGSAAAVASGSVMAALGTDTGGSVRQPASHTGCVGLRPTYGRVSRYGLIAFASSLDQIGTLTRSVEDAARLLEVMAGEDPMDASCSAEPVPAFAESVNRDVRGIRVGLPEEYLDAGVDPDVRAAVAAAAESLEAGGAEVRPVSLPHTRYGIATYYLICTAEASSNLARYDGAHYGLRAGEENGLDAMTIRTRHAGFGDEVRRRILLGTYVLSAGYYDAYYRKAQKVRTLILRDFESVFRSCDAVLGPTSPTTAFRFGEKTADPLSMYLSDIFTVTAPLAGLPALSVPAGPDRNGLPIGIQLTGRPFAEETLFGVAGWLERNSAAGRTKAEAAKEAGP